MRRPTPPLRRKHAAGPLRITVLEASHRVGGWLQSERQDGFLFEAGARGLR